MQRLLFLGLKKYIHLSSLLSFPSLERVTGGKKVGDQWVWKQSTVVVLLGPSLSPQALSSPTWSACFMDSDHCPPHCASEVRTAEPPRKQAAGGKWIMGSKLVRRKLNWKVLFLVSSNGENSHGNSLSGRWDQESHYFSSTDAKHHWEWWNVGLEGCIDFTWTCTMAWWRRLGVSVDGELVYHARTPGSHFSFWSQISKLNEEGYRHWLFGCAIILSACWGFLCHWQGLGFHWKYLIIYIIISRGENY